MKLPRNPLFMPSSEVFKYAELWVNGEFKERQLFDRLHGNLFKMNTENNNEIRHTMSLEPLPEIPPRVLPPLLGNWLQATTTPALPGSSEQA